MILTQRHRPARLSSMAATTTLIQARAIRSASPSNCGRLNRMPKHPNREARNMSATLLINRLKRFVAPKKRRSPGSQGLPGRRLLRLEPLEQRTLLTASISNVPSLDVDGNGTGDALTDGVVILRHLFGARGNELVEGALAPNATRTNPADIVGFLDAAGDTMLDVDGNGAADALTDGFLIMRYLFGSRNDALIQDAVAANATRSDAVSIEQFLDAHVGIPFQDDAGDTIANAVLLPTHFYELAIDRILGDSPAGGLDVDLFKLDVSDKNILVGNTLAVTASSASSDQMVDTVLRLFDVNGMPVATGERTEPGNSTLIHTFTAPGTYFLGVSGQGNDNYDPNLPNSGGAGDTGAYHLDLFVDVGVELIDDVLVIEGTKGNDDVKVVHLLGDVLAVSSNHIALNFDASRVNTIEVMARDGEDIIDLSTVSSKAIIWGGPGNDILKGGSGDDQLFGEGENDWLYGGGGINHLDGGAGDNSLFDQGKAVLRPTLLVVVHGFEPYRGAALGGGNGEWSTYGKELATRLEEAGSRTTTYLIDWNATIGSNTDATQRVADELARFVGEQDQIWDVFFLGHSRGAIFIKEVGLKLANHANLGVVRQILLDPTAANLFHDRGGETASQVRTTVYDDEHVLVPFGVTDGSAAIDGADYFPVYAEMLDNPTTALADYQTATAAGSGANTALRSEWVQAAVASATAWTTGMDVAVESNPLVPFIIAAADAIAYHVEITSWYLHKSPYSQQDISQFIAAKGSANSTTTRSIDVGQWQQGEHYQIFNAGPAQHNVDWRDILAAIVNYYRYADDIGLSVGQNAVDAAITLLRLLHAERSPLSASDKANIDRELDNAQGFSDAVFSAARALSNDLYKLLDAYAATAIDRLFSEWLAAVTSPAEFVYRFVTDLAGTLAAPPFSDLYMRGLLGSTFQGADTSALRDAMHELAANPRAAADELLARIASLRGRMVDAIKTEYRRFLELLDVRDQAVADGKDAVEALATKHSTFMGTVYQLRYGKVVADLLGIDPVLGSLLNPTGGLIGAGNDKLLDSGEHPVSYHGIVHDAAGYLYNYHDLGPGYDYLRVERPVGQPGSPTAGQVSGILYWCHVFQTNPVGVVKALWIVTQDLVRIAKALYLDYATSLPATAGALYEGITWPNPAEALATTARTIYEASTAVNGGSFVDNIRKTADAIYNGISWSSTIEAVTKAAQAIYDVTQGILGDDPAASLGKTADALYNGISWSSTTEAITNTARGVYGAIESVFGNDSAANLGRLAKALWGPVTNNFLQLADVLWDYAGNNLITFAQTLWGYAENDLGNFAQALWDNGPKDFAQLADVLWNYADSNISEYIRVLWTYASDTFALASVVWKETGDVVGLARGLRDWASRNAAQVAADLARGASVGTSNV
ncbi:MAG: hypothetical protein HUU20_23715, partial [Pirellulales bacterium]|nr:hypothetical protein [Pirellulales bacterium]